METKKVGGTEFVKNYNPRPMKRWQLALLVFCLLTIAFFVLKLAGAF
jgi:hypothetical protein